MRDRVPEFAKEQRRLGLGQSDCRQTEAHFKFVRYGVNGYVSNLGRTNRVSKTVSSYDQQATSPPRRHSYCCTGPVWRTVLRNCGLRMSPVCGVAETVEGGREFLFGGYMSATKDKLRVLKNELEFLDRGGYRSPIVWRSPRIFEDSPTCPKDRWSACPHGDCVFLDFVPKESRHEAIPCRHIPLNESGETLGHSVQHGYERRDPKDASRLAAENSNRRAMRTPWPERITQAEITLSVPRRTGTARSAPCVRVIFLKRSAAGEHFLLRGSFRDDLRLEALMSQMRKDVFTGRWVIMAETNDCTALRFSFQEIRAGKRPSAHFAKPTKLPRRRKSSPFATRVRPPTGRGGLCVWYPTPIHDYGSKANWDGAPKGSMI